MFAMKIASAFVRQNVAFTGRTTTTEAEGEAGWGRGADRALDLTRDLSFDGGAAPRRQVMLRLDA